MTSLATAYSGLGFARSLISSIVSANPRQIVWPVPAASGGQPPQAQVQLLADKATVPPGAQLTSGLGGYVAVLEEHRDELEITSHPVEQGAVISDHAYKTPASLTTQIGWTTSSALASGLPSFLGFSPLNIPFAGGLIADAGTLINGNNSFIRKLYAQLLALQAQRVLFTVYTGKRVYRNMLPRTISTRTTAETENALILVIQWQEINIARVQVVNAPINPTAQAKPEDTASPEQSGTQQLQPAPSYTAPPAPPSETIRT